MKSPHREAAPPEPKPKTEIPKTYQKQGLVWGEGKDGLYVYAETRALLKGVPDKVGDVPVHKRVMGKVRPARRR